MGSARDVTSISILRIHRSYADLSKAFRADIGFAYQHYYQYGFTEGRGSTFDTRQYMANYQDLQAAFGDDPDAAAIHDILHGRDEHRTDRPLAGAQVGAFLDDVR